MDGDPQAASFWSEEINGAVQAPMRKKRKYRTRKKEYQGWGSTSLIWFLKSIGRDTSTQIAQSEVANIVMDYVKQHNLFHKTKKKRIECDERLHSLFGRKTISRLKINDLLESHFAENCEESPDDILFESEDDENPLAAFETPRTAPSERKSQSKKPVFEKPRSCFAAIVPANIKLVYLKRSLVEDLLKDPETFEIKVVGSFIRIRCDPNDYLQKNSHQLLQVTGMKKSSEVNGVIHLQASGFFKDIRIQMLSDDNFSEKECEDLCRRVKDGLVKRPMTVDMEQTARILHEDMTKHWLARELILLQNLIDRANEKGWRRELDEYLQRREKLQSPDEQEQLLREFPKVIADDLESDSTTPDVPDKNVENNLQEFWQATCTKSSLVTEVPDAVANTKLDIADLVKQQSNTPKSIPILRGAPEVPLLDMTKNSTMLNCISQDTTEHQSCGLSLQLPPEKETDFGYKNDMSKPADSHEAKISQALPDKQMWSSQIQVIRLSDGLFVQQPPEQQTNLAYKDMSNPADSHEVKISQVKPDKPTWSSQIRAIRLTDVLSFQQPPEQKTDFAYKNDMSKPANSHEGEISQALPDKQSWSSHIRAIRLSDSLSVQHPPEQQTNSAYKNSTSWPAESHEGEISQALPDKQSWSSHIRAIRLSDSLSVQHPPEQQTNSAYKNSTSWPAESHDGKISQALPSKQIRPSQLEFIELGDDLSVQQLPEQQTNFPYNNGTSKPAKSCEAKISQTLPNKQIHPSWLDVIELSDGLLVQQSPVQQTDFAYNNGMSKLAESHEAKISQASANKQIQPSQIQVIELSDDDDDDDAAAADEENENSSTTTLVPAGFDTLMWHYRDPNGNVQGPFSLISLKHWSDAGYFPQDFKVWKSGTRQSEDVLLVTVLAQCFPF